MTKSTACSVSQKKFKAFLAKMVALTDIV